MRRVEPRVQAVDAVKVGKRRVRSIMSISVGVVGGRGMEGSAAAMLAVEVLRVATRDV